MKNSDTMIMGLPPEQAEGFLQTLRDIEIKTEEWAKHYNLAKALATQEKYGEAIKEYREAVNSSAGGWREHAARQELADSYQTTGKYHAAADEIQWMLNNSAEWTKPYLSERLVSIQLAARGDFQGAVEHARRALDLYMKSPPPHDYEDAYKQHLHLLEEKAKAIGIPALAEQRALPDDAQALTATLASASSDAQREEILKERIRQFPSDPTPYLFLGNFYDKLNKFPEAKWAYQEALRINPGHLGAMNGLGAVYMSEKDYAKAEAQFKEILAQNPKYAPAYVNYGFLRASQKQYQTAIELLTQAISLDPMVNKLEVVHTQLGDCYGWIKENDRAIQEYEIVCQLNPRALRAHLNLGSLYGMKAASDPGVLPKARVHFEKALEIDPDNAEAKQGLSMVAMLENHFAR